MSQLTEIEMETICNGLINVTCKNISCFQLYKCEVFLLFFVNNVNVNALVIMLRSSQKNIVKVSVQDADRTQGAGVKSSRRLLDTGSCSRPGEPTGLQFDSKAAAGTDETGLAHRLSNWRDVSHAPGATGSYQSQACSQKQDRGCGRLMAYG